MDAAPRNPPPTPATDGRYFIALRPSARARRELERAGLALARRHQGRALVAADLHLTLAFIGARPQAIEPALRAALTHLPPVDTLSFDRLGCFGRRLLWAGVRQAPAWLDDLVGALRRELDRRAIEHDHRPFVPHLTLVRGARPLSQDALGELQSRFEPIAAHRMQLQVGTTAQHDQGVRYRWIDAPESDKPS